MSEYNLDGIPDDDEYDSAPSPQYNMDGIPDDDDSPDVASNLQEKYRVTNQNPDLIATAKRNAEKSGLPMLVAQNQPEKAAKLAAAPDWTKLTTDAPVTSRALANDGTLFQIAHDDHEALGGIERGLLTLGKALPVAGPLVQAADTTRSLIEGMTGINIMGDKDDVGTVIQKYGENMDNQARKAGLGLFMAGDSALAHFLAPNAGEGTDGWYYRQNKGEIDAVVDRIATLDASDDPLQKNAALQLAQEYGFDSVPRTIGPGNVVNRRKLLDAVIDKRASAFQANTNAGIIDKNKRRDELVELVRNEDEVLKANAAKVDAYTVPWLVSNSLQFIQQIAQGAATSVAAGPFGAAVAFGAPVFGGEYATAKAAGKTDDNAALDAGASALIESATEMVGLKSIEDAAKGLLPILQGVGRATGTNFSQEQAAEIAGQVYNGFANQEFVEQPDYIKGLDAPEPVKQFLAILDQQLQSGVVGAAGGGAMAGTGAGVKAGVDKYKERKQAKLDEQVQQVREQIDTARTRSSQIIETIEKIRTSKLKARDTSSLKALIQSIGDAENDAPTAMLLSADAFKQGGIDTELFKRAVPSAADQVDRAIELGGTIAIDIGELANITDSEVEQGLIPHLKVREEEWTQFEAEIAEIETDEAMAEMQEAADTAAREAENQDEWTRQRQEIQTAYEDQLNKAGKYDKAANKKMAALVSAFYSTTASKLAKHDKTMTPIRLFNEAMMRVTGVKSGEGFNQNTGDNNSVDGEGNIYNQAAYHGSPYKFTKFTLDHMGKGEGAQAYGWGLYFAGKKEIAEHYRNALAVSAKAQGMQFNKDGTPNRVGYVVALLDAGIAEADILDGLEVLEDTMTDKERLAVLESGKKTYAAMKKAGQLYKVDIPEDDVMLHWDKPLSEQPEKVRAAVKAMAAEYADLLDDSDLTQSIADNETGDAFYRLATRVTGSDRNASRDLNRHGVSGIKYLDGTSRPSIWKYDVDVFGKSGGLFKQHRVRTQVDVDAIVAEAEAAGMTVKVKTIAQPDDGTYNYVIFDDAAINIIETYYQDGPKQPRGAFDPNTLNITLLEGADLSTFLHESGHFFLEMYARYADQSAEIGADMDALLKWFGIEGDDPASRLAKWRSMPVKEQRQFHEQFAESFEQYLFTGKAPSIELQPIFSTYRRFLNSVYKSLARFVAGHSGAKLNPEIAAVMDRMLATQDQIDEMTQARDSRPLFANADQAGMTQAQWDAYMQDQVRSVEQAADTLVARSLRDMKWMTNAKNKQLRKLQREAQVLRAQVQMEARRTVLSSPEYRAWLFLKRATEKKAKKPANSKTVDPSQDSLLTAIAKFGGLDMEEVVSSWGVDPADFAKKGGVFGKPVLRRTGGLSIETIAEKLLEEGYLTPDQHGKVDLAEFEEKLDRAARGEPMYSMFADYDLLLYGDEKRAAMPRREDVDYIGGRLNRGDLLEMYGTNNPEVKWHRPIEGLVYSGYDKKTSAPIKVKSDERQYTLFGTEGNSERPNKKRGGGKSAQGNMDAAKTIPGRYTTIVGREKQKTVNAGFDRLDTPEKVAFATSSITNQPQEVLLAIVTDESHRPLSILRHSIGMKDSSQVDHGIVAGWALNVPDGAHLWISHNHPSGASVLSDADKNVDAMISDLLRGTHIKPMGVLAVTHSGRFDYSTDDMASAEIKNATIPEPEKNNPVEISERILESTGTLIDDSINYYDDAVRISKIISEGQQGIMLLDAQHGPIGFIPVDFNNSSYIRGTDTQANILKALEYSNAAAAITYSPEKSTMALDGMQNVGALIKQANIYLLDAIMDDFSLAEKGIKRASDQFYQPAYHGSPYKFDKFSLDHMGKGEGAQAYGWGLYFAGSQEVADYYRESLKGTVAYDGKKINANDYEPGTKEYAHAVAVELLWSWQGDKEGALDDADSYDDDSRRIKTEIKKLDYSKISTATGQLYKVDIPEDDTYLLWDKPLNEQSEAVKKAMGSAKIKSTIKKAGYDSNDLLAEGIYKLLAQKTFGSQEATSKFLHSLGINGIKYLDGSSRSQGEGNYNYVIFDDNAIEIIETFYQNEDNQEDDQPVTGNIRTLESMGMVSDDGLHPDVVAELFGLSSGDELVRKLLEIDDPFTAVDKLTDKIMMERHSEFTDQKELERMAEAAIHNEARVRFVATELAMLNKAEGGQKDLKRIIDAARLYAQDLLAGQRIQDIRPSKHAADAARAGKESAREFAKGNLAATIMAKRNQVLHTELVRQAHAAKDEVDKGLKYFARIEKAVNNGVLDADYAQQIIGLLQQHDLRKSVSLIDLERRESLAAWVQAQQDAGFEPMIPENLLMEAAKTHYKRMTLDEFRELVDAIKNIDHLGRLKYKLVQNARKRELAAAAAEIGESIADNATGEVQTRLEKNSVKDRIFDLANGFLYMHRKFASLIRQMDGWKDGGVLWDYFVKTMNDAGDREAVMREQATMAMADLMKPLHKSGGFGMMPKKLFITQIGTSLTREGRLMVALNWGNEGNRQRLMDGEGWDVNQVNAVLATLNAEDWKFVQGVWDHLETYRPMVGEQQKRLSGVEPKWIEASPFMVAGKDGQTYELRGGYLPVKYDADRSTKSLTQDALSNIMDQHKAVRAKTRDSFTKGRAAKVVNRPLRKDFGVIFQHMTEVTHRLAWQDWLMDSKRLLAQPAVDEAVRKHYGPAMVTELQKTLDDIAIGEVGPANEFEAAINHLRTGATVAGLGLNFMTSLMQPLGLTQSMVRIGPTWVMKGLAKWGRMEDALPWIYERSDFMRLRGKTFQREINEELNKIRSPKRAAFNELMFVLIQKGQIIADVPTWLGAYEKAIAEQGPNIDEKLAAKLADQAVLDAQSGGMQKDLARIQRGGSLQRLFTMFYSYFSSTYTLSVESVRKVNVKDPATIMSAAIDFLLLYSIPAAISTAISSALTGDDDEDEFWGKMARGQVSYFLSVMVGLREFGAVVSGFSGYSGPAGTRFFNEAAKLATQIGQGDMDAALLKALNNVGGILFHYPAGQINKTIDGAVDLSDDKTDNPAALLFGSRK